MSLFIASLNSGSNGNCFYVGTEREAILVDAGISCRETVKRLDRLGLSINRIKGIFVTHEHADHINGIPKIVKKYNIPVYVTANTLREGRLNINEGLVKHFTAYNPIAIGNLTVSAFPKLHDACDPHSFVVSSNNVRVGVFTDIGYACKHVIDNFKKCHAVFLESNYDEKMLEAGGYSYFLKNRIRGGKGHLSNVQALKLFREHRTASLSHLFLSHLSENNNCPKLASTLFTKYAGPTKVIVASRYEETQVYHITGNHFLDARVIKPKLRASQFQLSLFQ